MLNQNGGRDASMLHYLTHLWQIVLDGGGERDVDGTNLYMELQGYESKLHIYCTIQREPTNQLVCIRLCTDTFLLHLPIAHRQRWLLEQREVFF